MSLAKKIYGWASKKANSPFATLWLGLIFFLEIIFLLPMDAILLLFCLENPQRRYTYAMVATAASTASGVAGYLIGLAAWDIVGDFVLQHFVSPGFFERMSTHYQIHQNWAVFFGGLLPVPFKVVALTAGVCELAILPFIAMIFVARFARFFLIARVVQKWGIQIKTFVDQHFHRFLFAVGAKIALAFTFFWALA